MTDTTYRMPAKGSKLFRVADAILDGAYDEYREQTLASTAEIEAYALNAMGLTLEPGDAEQIQRVCHHWGSLDAKSEDAYYHQVEAPLTSEATVLYETCPDCGADTILAYDEGSADPHGICKACEHSWGNGDTRTMAQRIKDDILRRSQTGAITLEQANQELDALSARTPKMDTAAAIAYLDTEIARARARRAGMDARTYALDIGEQPDLEKLWEMERAHGAWAEIFAQISETDAKTAYARGLAGLEAE